MARPKIYYKDESEKHRLREKYPQVNATWLPIPDEMSSIDGPIVCKDQDDLEKCPVGEKYIERLIPTDEE